MTEWNCWHCQNTNLCDCFLCVIDLVNARKPGPCLACKGHRRAEAMRPYLEANNINPGEARWWTFDNDGKRRFIPAQLFDRGEKP